MADADPAVRYHAVWFAGETSHAGWLHVRRAALHDPDPWVRDRAAYTLSFAGLMLGRWPVRALLALYTRPGEHYAVRAQAAEGLANHLTFARPQVTPIYRKAERALIAGLRDARVEVRFWSAFALGNMVSRTALPELRRLAESDHELCPGWWPVADEAVDAIAAIEGRDTPLRDCDVASRDRIEGPDYL